MIATDRCHELDSEAMNEVAARCLEQIAMEVVLVASLRCRCSQIVSDGYIAGPVPKMR